MPSTDLATIYGRAVDLSVCDGGHTGRTRDRRPGRAGPGRADPDDTRDLGDVGL